MSDVKDAVVKRIRALCEEKNIKPNELANRAGLTPSTVYSIFNENRHDVNILRFAYIQWFYPKICVNHKRAKGKSVSSGVFRAYS